MNKRLMPVLLTAVLLLPGALCANTQEQNDIEIKITDYARDPYHVLVHANKPVTAEMFFSKGIYPISIEVHNKSDEPVTITPHSIQVPVVNACTAARTFHRDNQYLSSLFLESFLLGSVVNGGLLFVNPFAWGSLVAIAADAATDFQVGGGLVTLSGLSIIVGPGTLVGFLYWLYKRSQNKGINARFARDLVSCDQQRIMIQPGAKIRKFMLLKKTPDLNAFTFRLFDATAQTSVASFSVYLEM